MTGVEIIKFGAFGYSFLVGLVSFSLSDDLRNPKFFKRCVFASIVSLSIGSLLELMDTMNLESGMTLLLMSVSSIYLGFYQILKMLFRAWKGTDPYITSASSIIGGTPLGGYWTKYPKNRKIMWTDFLFSFAQALLPIITIGGLIVLIMDLNK